ncbi:MAG: hemolysin family protein [Acholeplasmataceae bacterium]|nr:hemolysin family protein [Acholeplasmataceae bacterium]
MFDSIGALAILLMILIGINGFFAASEMALVSMKKQKMKNLAQKGNKNAKLVLKVTQDSTKYLSTIQVAITLAGFMSSALAGARLSSTLVDMFSNMGITISTSLAVVIITLILSFLTLVLGELVPKKLALENPNKFALISIKAVYVVMIVTKPFVWLLSISTKFVLKILRFKPDVVAESITEDEIRRLINLGQVQGLYKKQEKEMLENIFKFDDINANSIKTPRTKTYGVDINRDKKDILLSIVNSKYSRVLIYDHDIEHILGIIHVKDIMDYVVRNDLETLNIKTLLRPPYYVPKDIKISKLFKDMQIENHHIALLIDQHGGFEGIVTLEDIIEEIVGNIYDEHDLIEKQIKKINQNTYLIEANTSIRDINMYLGLNLEEKPKKYHSIRGLYIYLLGHIPKENKTIEIDYKNVKLDVDSFINENISKIILKIVK